MTLQWIAAPAFVGSSGTLGLSDAELITRCAPGAQGLPPDQQQPFIDECRAQVNAVRGGARRLFSDAQNTTVASRSIASEIDKLLEKSETSVVAGDCAGARSLVTSARTKWSNLVANAEKMGNLHSQVLPMPNEAFGEAEVTSIVTQVGLMGNEVETLTDGMGGAIENASVAVNECVAPPGPPRPPTPPPVTPTKKKKKKADLGLLLLGGASVVAIGFALRGGGMG